MKYHIAWSILAVVSYVLHMVAGLYIDSMYFLPEYIWFVSIGFSVAAIYSGSITAYRNTSVRGKAIASAVIGAIILGGLLMSATTWLFIPENGFNMITSLIAII